jgi:proteasome lid subunit RPN8/RPN11
MRVRGILRETLEFILSVANSSHPNEFIALLEAEEEVIKDLIFLPGTATSDSLALMRLEMMPLGMKVAGTVHSHPSPPPVPSDEDLFTFSKIGGVHIIVAHPYDMKSWRCYNSSGKEIPLKVLEEEP